MADCTEVHGTHKLEFMGWMYLLTLIVLAVPFVLLYKDVVRHALHQWNTLGMSHTPLIIAVSLYLLWIQRDRIRNAKADPALFSGGLLLASGCFALFAGKISSTMLVQQVSLVPVLLGMVLMLGGFPYFKLFLLPVGYLIFVTGLVDQILGEFAIHLQLITAWLATLLLKLMGFSVFQDGIVIMLPHITLEVVRACSGINQIMSLLALAIPLGYLTQRTLARKVILISSALVIALVANGLRAALIGVYALYNPDANLHGPAETLSATMIFFFGLVVLILFSMLLARTGRGREPHNAQGDSSDQPQHSNGEGRQAHPRKRLASFLAALALLGGTYGLVHSHSVDSVPPERPLTLLPDRLAGFSARKLGTLPDRIRPFPAHRELMRRYEDGQGNSIELYIGYFGLQNRRKKLIDYRRAWMHERASKVQVSRQR